MKLPHTVMAALRGSLQVRFDRSILKRNWQRVNLTPLQRAGLYIRSVMRRSIRKDTSKFRNRPSRPGTPPRSRAPGHPFRQIFSEVDRFHTQVLVGHVGYNQPQTPMEAHEFGQVIRVPMRRRQARRSRTARQAEAARRLFQMGQLAKPPVTGYRLVKLPKRAFAAPALEKSKSKLPALWRNSIHSGTVRNR